MPQFPAGVVSDEQLSSIVAYVQAIPQHDAHGGWPIGGVGPLSEGLVGWVVGLGVLAFVIRLLGKRAAR
jgi:ubiquinol-cytochrome c reductase cytochrome c subunit